MSYFCKTKYFLTSYLDFFLNAFSKAYAFEAKVEFPWQFLKILNGGHANKAFRNSRSIGRRRFFLKPLLQLSAFVAYGKKQPIYDL